MMNHASGHIDALRVSSVFGRTCGPGSSGPTSSVPQLRSQSPVTSSLADPVDPPGLEYNSTFGRSSNQEMLNGGPELEIAADEFVFLRPHQSEAVFLQFGDIAVYEDGEIVGRWPVFPASA